MPIKKYIDRLRRMDDLIRRKATGTPEEFALRMGVQKSTLLLYVKELRKIGAEITYNRDRQSYQYEGKKKFRIGFYELSESDMETKKAGGFLLSSKSIHPVMIRCDEKFHTFSPMIYKVKDL